MNPRESGTRLVPVSYFFYQWKKWRTWTRTEREDSCELVDEHVDFLRWSDNGKFIDRLYFKNDSIWQSGRYLRVSTVYYYKPSVISLLKIGERSFISFEQALLYLACKKCSLFHCFTNRPREKSVLWTLLKFTLAMIILPISCFFLSKKMVFEGSRSRAFCYWLLCTYQCGTWGHREIYP